MEQLHERMLSHDPTATLDVFLTFMEPLLKALERKPGCKGLAAYDSAIDAILEYRDKPRSYELQRGTLLTFLTVIARRNAQDDYRKDSARTRREQNPQAVFEIHPPVPNTYLEDQVDAKKQLERLATRIEAAGLPERDLAGIRVIIATENRCPAEQMAAALGVSHLPPAAQLHAVRRNTDRLRKRLKSFREEDIDVES
ncbi:sigma-70 family RNA polymerase sigma factor [Corallococcus sp. AB050B]|nr:sigma-70 family RNA polymerase sigma factor [Corallococcus sp. AB050B]